MFQRLKNIALLSDGLYIFTLTVFAGDNDLLVQ